MLSAEPIPYNYAIIAGIVGSTHATLSSSPSCFSPCTAQPEPGAPLGKLPAITVNMYIRVFGEQLLD